MAACRDKQQTQVAEAIALSARALIDAVSSVVKAASTCHCCHSFKLHYIRCVEPPLQYSSLSAQHSLLVLHVVSRKSVGSRSSTHDQVVRSPWRVSLRRPR
ncbi:hypothetical protein F441_04856 [Phytophthora nicotianae CJ01A1]|uniref:Uncharacterized protein n=6 Tax=Phytophthora nicotianae TaxID=4792 RepID=W2QI51_PHYN3|nr:hypothetical protein PPTG_22470 [Phytophthora nicotianae INRA-310]ETI51845.1 hypothetical protein F443_04859 [Phytophthora nicotianae P1569]ETK91734.1 hypothetical protein L915_04725 [Phytophthora nicotianae]ETO80597.1 hypothetical protein F444_04897 [Phytophthora nicotianae P1976]ETP21627.1 hypothetical protein F441_04856 [Phytophthora nicotianae CJ01A1]ETP49520.1 hypothetical protein F442_04927 [Phytophthora nicotianae P10297]